tara:strand:+ start:19211 stop:19375 length:165 start_codon:yes stop_codon:yes gene_type:complete
MYNTIKAVGLEVKKLGSLFSECMYGTSAWDLSFKSIYKFIKRTLSFSFELNKYL